MEVSKLSQDYQVRKLTKEDATICYHLMQSNPQYFLHCPPEATIHTPIEDMEALPPNKTMEDKYYVGLFDKDSLVAIVDIILKYPYINTVFIGFFMMNTEYQGKGIGTRIVQEMESYFQECGYSYIMLGYSKTNPQSKHFWEKNQFTPTGTVVNNEDYDVVVMHKKLEK